MRKLITLILLLSIASGTAWAQETKPIKPAASKEEASSPPKEETKPVKETKSTKESKASEAARIKEQQAADELAAKIAERLSSIRKEKDEVGRAGARANPRVYAPPIRRPESVVQEKKVVNANAHAANNAHWEYEGENGPMNWGKINSANSKCEIGERQSPIDIRDGIKVDLDVLRFDYKPSSFSVIDNGHTIQVNVGSGNNITISGRSFELQQLHFHKPSEERINGKGFDMVAHLVHKDREGKLAVVAVLLEGGSANSVVQQIWNNLPLEKNEAVKAINNLDLNQLLPSKRDYYTYMGSLTTPPCTEGVLWLVLKTSVELSADQIDIFNRFYPMNARPIQRTSTRVIKESK
jgi:carbonic anhydrase